MNNGFVSRRRKTHTLTLSQKTTQRCCPSLMRLLSNCLRGHRELNQELFWILWIYWFCFPASPGSNYRPALFCHRYLQPEASKPQGCSHGFFSPVQALWCPNIRRPTESGKTVWKQKLFLFLRNVLHFL